MRDDAPTRAAPDTVTRNGLRSLDLGRPVRGFICSWSGYFDQVACQPGATDQAGASVCEAALSPGATHRGAASVGNAVGRHAKVGRLSAQQAPPISERAVPVARIRVGGRAISVAALRRARAKGNGRREPAGFRAGRTNTRAHGIATAHLALGAVIGTVALEKHRIRATRRFAVRGGPIPPATRGRPFLADLRATSDRARTSIATIRNRVSRIPVTT